MDYWIIEPEPVATVLDPGPPVHVEFQRAPTDDLAAAGNIILASAELADELADNYGDVTPLPIRASGAAVPEYRALAVTGRAGMADLGSTPDGKLVASSWGLRILIGFAIGNATITEWTPG